MGWASRFLSAEAFFLFQKQLKGQKLIPRAKTAMLEMIHRQY